MKKNSLFITWVLFLTLFLIGCGSNSKLNPIFSDPGGGSGGENGYELVNMTTPFDISYAGERKQFKVQLLQFGVPVIAETISVAGLDAQFGVVLNATAPTDASGYATFEYEAADPLVNGLYPLEVFYEGVIATDDNTTLPETFKVVTILEINVQESGVPENGKSLYSLTNVTNPFLITYAGQEKSFRVQVLKENVPTAAETVYISSLPLEFGTVTNASAQSDESGFATFNYIANDPITNGNYKLDIFHTDENGSKVSTLLDINIDEGAVEFNYQLTNPTTPIKLEEAGQQGEISSYLVDENGIGIAGETVNISILDTAYGSVDSTVSTTDGSGKASFKYTASPSLEGLSSTVVTMSFTENGITTSQKVDIIVENQSYTLVNPTTPVMLTEPSQKGEISVYLVGKDGLGVEGKNVNISILDGSYGSVDLTVSKTDASGKALFNYTGASNLEGLSRTVVTLSFTENGITITQAVDIIVENQAYTLVNPTTPVMLTEPSQKGEISVYLVGQDGVGVDGKSVNISIIDRAYGSVDATVSTTDKSGRASFKYTGAPELDGLTATKVTLSFTENGITTSQMVDIIVDKGFNYNLTNPTTPLIVETPSQESELFVYLVDENGIGIKDKIVNITTIDGNYGSISPSASVTDEAGKALFAYVAPTSLDDLTSTKATLSFTENGLTIYSEIEIKVIPLGAGSDYKLVNAKTPISVVDEIKQQVVDVQLTVNGLPVVHARPCEEGSDLLAKDCIIPDSIPREYGRLRAIVDDNDLIGDGETQDGYVYFAYIPPSIIDKADIGT